MSRAARLGTLAACALLAACSAIIGIDDRSLDPELGADAGNDAPAADTGSDVNAPVDAPSDRGADAPAESGGNDAASDGPSCTSPEVACNGACVNVATSQENCGACGHSCGGGACTLGVCQPVTVQSSITGLQHYAVDSTGVYYTSDTDKVFVCPLTGCTLAPRQVAAMGSYTNVIQVGNGVVLFESAPVQNTSRPAVYACPTSGCVTPQMVLNAGLSGVDQLFSYGKAFFYSAGGQPLEGNTCAPDADGGTSVACAGNVAIFHRNVCGGTADANGIYFIDTVLVDGGGTTNTPLLKCPLDTATACSAPATVLANLACGTKFVTNGTQLFTLTPGTQGAVPDGVVRVCTLANCTLSPFINKQPYPTDLAASATDVFWFNSDEGAIKTCKATGCVGGARTLVTTTGVSQMREYGGFLYWVEGGNKIRRVAY